MKYLFQHLIFSIYVFTLAGCLSENRYRRLDLQRDLFQLNESGMIEVKSSKFIGDKFTVDFRIYNNTKADVCFYEDLLRQPGSQAEIYIDKYRYLMTNNPGLPIPFNKNIVRLPTRDQLNLTVSIDLTKPNSIYTLHGNQFIVAVYLIDCRDHTEYRVKSKPYFLTNP